MCDPNNRYSILVDPSYDQDPSMIHHVGLASMAQSSSRLTTPSSPSLSPSPLHELDLRFPWMPRHIMPGSWPGLTIDGQKGSHRETRSEGFRSQVISPLDACQEDETDAAQVDPFNAAVTTELPASPTVPMRGIESPIFDLLDANSRTHFGDLVSQYPKVNLNFTRYLTEPYYEPTITEVSRSIAKIFIYQYDAVAQYFLSLHARLETSEYDSEIPALLCEELTEIVRADLQFKRHKDLMSLLKGGSTQK
jgi:hypothetical protein